MHALFVLTILMLLGMHNTTECPDGTFFIDNECIKCPPGRGSMFCTLCVPGTYKYMWGVTPCNTCEPGTVSAAVGATSKSTCQVCNQGTYSSPDNVECLSCPGNTTSPAASSLLRECLAKPGFYAKAGTEATICPENHYCPASIMLPIPCPPNMFARTGSSACSSPSQDIGISLTQVDIMTLSAWCFLTALGMVFILASRKLLFGNMLVNKVVHVINMRIQREK